MAFDLHRAEKQPDWEKVSPEDRNIWQRVAHKTKGIVTPGNAVSLLGAGLVLDGLYDVTQKQYASGITKIFFGRVADIADGVVADKTGTKSSTGEAVDATIDKLEMAAALVAFTVSDAVPDAAVVAVGAQNIANAGLTIAAKLWDKEIHPNKAGKWNTFGQWAGLGSFLISEASSNDAVQTTFETLGWTGTIGSTFILGSIATYGLAKDAFSHGPVDTEAN